MPIYKMVAIDRMRVTGYLDAGDAWHVRQGQTVRIMPELEGGDLPIEREVFEGKITFVDSEIDPKTRTCRIFVEVENRGGLLRSGLECRMELDLQKNTPVQRLTTLSGNRPRAVVLEILFLNTRSRENIWAFVITTPRCCGKHA
jgi:multidrug efflux pump subunit AcrA (membrane-fusion protein)